MLSQLELIAAAAVGAFLFCLCGWTVSAYLWRRRYARQQAQLEHTQQQWQSLLTEHQALQTEHALEQRHAQEQINFLQQSEVRLNQQFENLANRIFEQKHQRFEQTSQQQMDALLQPMKEQLGDFRRQIEQAYGSEARQRAELKSEIHLLKQLNRQMSEETLNLTRALKGDNKQQGNWGEVVLARVLSESGLREGHEYELQVSDTDASGRRQQPDVVVHLPDNKDVIIDAKVSLTAYEAFFNAEQADSRQQALERHLASLRSHIKGLGNKAYHQLGSIRSLDYVLLFVPIEGAFLAALNADPKLTQLAAQHNVMLVSPTNLLIALRTIHSIWQVEQQNRNAQTIAERAAALYDKLRLFVEELERVGKALQQAQGSYETAMKRLSHGRGNLIKQAEGFRELGVAIKKPIDPNLSEPQQGDEAAEPALKLANDTPHD